MLNKKITIETKNNLPEELKTKKLLEDVLAKYPCPIFTDRTLIEDNLISYSHPILTIGTFWFMPKEKIQFSQMRKDVALLILLEIFSHEQFHWFLKGRKNFWECINYLRSRYKELGDCDTSKNRINFWTHLIVRWNTRNFLNKTLTKDQIDFIYGQGRSQPLTEEFIKDNFEQLRQDLEKFDMVYRSEL